MNNSSNGQALSQKYSGNRDSILFIGLSAQSSHWKIEQIKSSSALSAS